SSASAAATASVPSLVTRCVATSYPASVSAATRARPLLSSRVPPATPSDTVNTFATKLIAPVSLQTDCNNCGPQSPDLLQTDCKNWGGAGSRVGVADGDGRGSGVVGAEDAGAGDEDVDARVDREVGIVDLDAAVD